MRLSDNAFPDAPRPPGTLLDARLHLLDRQLLDAGGEPVGIIEPGCSTFTVTPASATCGARLNVNITCASLLCR